MSYIACTLIEVCVFKFEDDRPMYLLLKRRKDENLYPGIWQYVTGSIEGKEKAVDAALRELQEETGLVPQHFWVVPFVNSFYDPNYDSLNLMSVFAAQVQPGDSPILSSEHEKFIWLPFDEARRKLVWPGQCEGLRIIHEYIVRGEEAAKLNQIR
ncbi:MAG: NUDIX domain-containing protein [Ignavibacteriae bacterium]|nr:NUDIX domain-containing protein [Ignavibacteria bacterium]MBI3365466.1 NUDIX domain-containing protein [Ignavibacteriota bacterium]